MKFILFVEGYTESKALPQSLLQKSFGALFSSGKMSFEYPCG